MTASQVGNRGHGDHGHVLEGHPRTDTSLASATGSFSASNWRAAMPTPD